MERQPSKTEGERKYKKYIYRDNSAGRKIVFECVARNILEADELYKAQTGNDPRKQVHVGCSIELADIPAR